MKEKQRSARKGNLRYALYISLIWITVYIACYLITGSIYSVVCIGIPVRLAVSWALRLCVPWHHVAGKRFFKKEQYEKALACFRESEAFFARHPWVDKYRFITAMSASEWSFYHRALIWQAMMLCCLARGEEAMPLLQSLPATIANRSIVDDMIQQLQVALEKDREKN